MLSIFHRQTGHQSFYYEVPSNSIVYRWKNHPDITVVNVTVICWNTWVLVCRLIDMTCADVRSIWYAIYIVYPDIENEWSTGITARTLLEINCIQEDNESLVQIMWITMCDLLFTNVFYICTGNKVVILENDGNLEIDVPIPYCAWSNLI